MFKWMVNCKAVSRIVSESMDESLPLHRRLWMWMHLAMCGHCAEFRNQLRLIRRAACEDEIDGVGDDQSARLNDEARGRIQKALEDRCGTSS